MSDLTTDLFCIHHGKMVRASKDYAGRLFHYETVLIGGDRDPGNRFDIQECVFPDGYAACPPVECPLEPRYQKGTDDVEPCQHERVEVRYKLYTRETRFEPAEYIGKARCQDCGECMEPEEVPDYAERKEVFA